VSLAEHGDRTGAVRSNSRPAGRDEVERPMKDEELAAEVSRLKSDLNTRIDTLTSDNDKLREQNKQLETKLETSVSDLDRQIGDLKKKQQHSEAELRESQQQNDKLKAVIKTKEDSITILTGQLSRVKADVQAKEDEITSLNKQLSETKKVVKDKSQQLKSSDYELAQRRCDELLLETETLRSKLQYATAQHGILHRNFFTVLNCIHPRSDYVILFSCMTRTLNVKHLLSS